MEKISCFGGVKMEKYIRPSIITQNSVRGIFPLAAVIAGVSAVEAAAAVGVAVGVAKTMGGRDFLPEKSLVLQNV